MIAGWSVRFRDGRQICHHQVNAPKGIGVLVVDRKSQSHKEWFQRAGWADIPMYSYRDDPKTNWEDFLQRPKLKGLLLHGLERLEKDYGVGRGSLIICDPISPFIAGNLIDYKHTLVGLGMIDQLCGERGVTIIGIAHMGKQKSEKDRYSRPQDRILGSAALGGFTDTQIYMLGPDDTDHGHYELGWIPHNAPAEQFAFERDELGLFIPAPLDDAELDAVRGIMACLTAEGPGAATKTKQIVGFCTENYASSQRTVERTLQHLVYQAKVERKGRGLYALPALSVPGGKGDVRIGPGTGTTPSSGS